jgi:hypothetical protein
MARLTAVSDSAQQARSVYLNTRRGLDRLAALDSREPIAAQYRHGLSRAMSPVLDGLEHDRRMPRDRTRRPVARGAGPRRSGSRAFERFTVPQIRAFAARDPRAYADTRAFISFRRFSPPFSPASTRRFDPGDVPA